MKNFKLVIIDYPKLMLDNSVVKKALSDMIISKQINFKRASSSYISLNSQDMISTHYLIYDVTNIFEPKQVLAIRTCYQNRSQYHKLALPAEDYIQYSPESYQEKFRLFKSRVGNVVDCNAHYVDEDYTFTKTGINLSEIAYYALVMFILRKGFSNWVGATNEKFKASRWASKTGYFEDDLIFTHPKVEDPHKLIMIEKFNESWIYSCHNQYSSFLKEALELVPSVENEILMTYDEALSQFMSKPVENYLTA